jgi:uncharacterized protein
LSNAQYPWRSYKLLDEAGVNMLDGEVIEVAGVDFAGIAGFGGGFGWQMLNAWSGPLN